MTQPTETTTPTTTPATETKATNITFHEGTVSRENRTSIMGHQGATLWLTGLSGSGKSTVAVALEQMLIERGLKAYRLDGDNIRFGLNKNLGFSPEDRTENIRRISEVTKLFADAGMLCLNSFVSPFAEDRNVCRKLHEEAGLPFYEVYIHCPLEVAESRDPKGLYKKARAGEIKDFTGIHQAYEEPKNPEILIKSAETPVAQAAQQIITQLEKDNIIPTTTTTAPAPPPEIATGN